MAIPEFISNDLLLNVAVAIALILLGVLVGNIVGYLLKKIAEKFEFKRKVSESFIKLIIFVIKISIFITFLVLAFYQLEVPVITEVVGASLLVIPAFTGASILLGAGLAIAIYIREVIEDSEVTGWKISSQIIFYFIVYVIGLYSLRIALSSINEFVRNWILISLTAICTTALAYYLIKKELRPIHASSR